MRHISPQRFILYGRTFIVPALCMLFVAGLLYKKAEFFHGRFMDCFIRLEGSVTVQENIRAVKHLQYTYGYCLEMGLWNDLSDLFSDDAAGRFQGVILKGKEAIRNHLMAEAGRRTNGISYGRLNVHLMMQPVITLGPDGKTAKGTWHEMAMLGEYNVSATWRGGVYENEYGQAAYMRILRYGKRENGNLACRISCIHLMRHTGMDGQCLIKISVISRAG